MTPSLLIILSVCLYGHSWAQDHRLQSPSSNNLIEIYLEDELSYSVMHNDVAVLDKSPISITIDGVNYGSSPSLTSATERESRSTVIPVIKSKQAEIIEHYNELVLTFRESFQVTFRAYDDCIAYRISTSLPGNVQVDAEEITYRFKKNYLGSYPISDGFFSHYERNYVTHYLDNFPDTAMSCLPALIYLEDGMKAVITEADLYDYPGFYLASGDGLSLQGILPQYPAELNRTSDRDERVAKREEFLANTAGTRTYPWRVMVISDQDKDLLMNESVYLLSRENSGSDFSWVKPGKVAWDWYHANNIYGVDFKSGINTDTYKHYIDFAAQYGLDYIILDEGWYDIKTNDLLHPVPEIDLEALVAYGRDKAVEIILWVTWLALEDQLETALDQFVNWGIKGVKVDFMQRDDQWMVKYFEKVSQATADRKLLVDFHGSYKPAGLRRAYPNLITREGLKGLENNKWDGQFCNPENDLQIPFTRMLAGPMDYTPGAMLNAQKANYRAIWDRPMSLGTRCHQLAMYVVYESPLQMLADAPSHYMREPDCMEFLSEVPTIWDETQVQDAAYGDYVLMARRNGDTWYVAAMTDWDARDLSINFDFLPSGTYEVTAYQDGVNAHRMATDYKKIDFSVVSSDRHQVHLAPGGGWVAVIQKRP